MRSAEEKKSCTLLWKAHLISCGNFWIPATNMRWGPADLISSSMQTHYLRGSPVLAVPSYQRYWYYIYSHLKPANAVSLYLTDDKRIHPGIDFLKHWKAWHMRWREMIIQHVSVFSVLPVDCQMNGQVGQAQSLWHSERHRGSLIKYSDWFPNYFQLKLFPATKLFASFTIQITN